MHNFFYCCGVCSTISELTKCNNKYYLMQFPQLPNITEKQLLLTLFCSSFIQYTPRAFYKQGAMLDIQDTTTDKTTSAIEK